MNKAPERETMTTITADDLKTEIERAWAERDGISTATTGPVRTAG